jgi:hypothetical protein
VLITPSLGVPNWSVINIINTTPSNTKFIFEFIGIYGSTDHARKSEFLQDLEAKVARS